MHTMGLAFDIALVNTPLETVYEIRDVLRQMHEAGDILVIGERKQLVFHVVPHPSRLGHFTDVYARALQGTLPRAGDLESTPVAAVTPLAEAVVSTEIVGIRPTDEHMTEWWAADDAHTDLTMAVTPPVVRPQIGGEKRSFFARIASRIVTAFGGVVHSARSLIA